ncbi:MAG: exodeoxyribonuclease VII large subunit, partial [Clostridia bacterium]|nr:exodeoxyribonuclease VII large subunit [Clostridia bacterium]
GQGLLFLECEKLKQKLDKEGLFAAEHKKPIPKYAHNVLVVTSKTGAVIRDIVTTVRRKNPVVNITVRDVRVQGEGAGHDIAGVLKRMDTLGYDVIIIARGGGSLEDLAPFYDEELVRAVYALNTPVISAVGHETDFSLCDFVADMRAPTPTAAGELVAYDYYGMIEDVKAHLRRLSSGAVRAYKSASAKAQVSFGRLRSVANSFYSARARKIERLIQSAKSNVERKYDAASARAERATDALDKLSPLKTLKRGYFRLQLGSETVSRVEGVKVGDKITATGGDGTLTATVTDVQIYPNNKEN